MHFTEIDLTVENSATHLKIIEINRSYLNTIRDDVLLFVILFYCPLNVATFNW